MGSSEGSSWTYSVTTDGVAIGVHLFSNMRAEFELSQSLNDTSEIGEPYTSYDGSINASFALANLWYDLPTETKITPYVGGGLGYARISHVGSSAGIPLVDDSDTSFSAQIGIGGRVSIGARGAIDIGYRYKIFDGADLEQLFVGSRAAHCMLAGP
jgi:opacity protein-like surface antigen